MWFLSGLCINCTNSTFELRRVRGSSSLYLSHLHFLVFAGPRSNCHQSDCSLLDAMEAVIGHPRHGDQCHRYYRGFQAPRPPDCGPSRGPKGNCRGEAPQLVMAAQRPDNRSSKVSIDSSPFQHAFCSFPAGSLTLHQRLNPSLGIISHPASLTGHLSLHFSCCHTSPVKKVILCPSYDEKINPGVTTIPMSVFCASLSRNVLKLYNNNTT